MSDEEKSNKEDQLDLVSQPKDCSSPLLNKTDGNLVLTRMSQEMASENNDKATEQDLLQSKPKKKRDFNLTQKKKKKKE